MKNTMCSYRRFTLIFAHCSLPIASCLLLFAFCLLPISSNAQSFKHKIAIFAPLYLDSAFDDQSNYRYDKQFPKFLNPGLEFYEGVQLALDTLAKEGSQL